MPQAIPAAAQAFAQWAVATFASSAASAAVVHAVAYYGAQAAIYAGISMGLSAVSQAGIPTPEGQKITRKQPRPLRVYPFGGPSRMSGAYMLRESSGNKLGVVIAICEGRVIPFERIYLNDTRVTVSGGFVQGQANERYGTGDLIRLETRLGVPTETHYGFLTANFGAYWPTSARGDGIASLGFLAQHRSRESFARHFPDGEPIPSVVTAAVCYDWRKDTTAGGSGPQRRNNPDTWQMSWNPVVWLVHVEWHRHGQKWDRRIAPVLAALTVEADYCDEEITVEGVTEARYRCAGNVFSNTEPQALREAILATMDGWMTTDGKGRLVIKAGRYDAPDWTLTPEHIRGATWRTFQPDEDVVDEIVASYISPDHDYSEVEAGAWRDEDAIAVRGVARSEALTVQCPSATQAVRLAGRKGKRLNALARGQVRADIDGLNGLGRRYIAVQNPIVPGMEDIVVEVLNVEIDFASASVIFDVILADPTIDDDEVVVEGPGVIDRPPVEPGYQDPATRPVGRDVEFPFTSAGDSISVEAFNFTRPDGRIVEIVADTIPDLDPLTSYGVFWREDVGLQAEAFPAPVRMTSGSWVFLGWQSTSDGLGGYPTGPTPPGGWGGNDQAVLP